MQLPTQRDRDVSADRLAVRRSARVGDFLAQRGRVVRAVGQECAVDDVGEPAVAGAREAVPGAVG
jgi:hypothetical protein